MAAWASSRVIPGSVAGEDEGEPGQRQAALAGGLGPLRSLQVHPGGAQLLHHLAVVFAGEEALHALGDDRADPLHGQPDRPGPPPRSGPCGRARRPGPRRRWDRRGGFPDRPGAWPGAGTWTPRGPPPGCRPTCRQGAPWTGGCPWTASRCRPRRSPVPARTGLDDQLLAQPFDVHGAPAGEVEDPLDPLGRALEVHAVAVGLPLEADQRTAAHRARDGEDPRGGVFRSVGEDRGRPPRG